MLFTIRVSIPDRPGNLAAVAGALGAADCNILGVDVLERADGYALDDLCVEADRHTPSTLRRIVEGSAAAVVEAVTPVDQPHDHTGAVELAGRLGMDGGHALETLVEGLPGALWATWAMAIDVDDGGLRVLARSDRAPVAPTFDTPWLPLSGVRRLDAAQWMPSAWRLRAGIGTLEFAAAPLFSKESAVLIARSWSARFRRAELAQLGLLTDIAVLRLGTRLAADV